MSNGQEYVISIPIVVQDKTNPGVDNANKKVDNFTKGIKKVGQITDHFTKNISKIGQDINSAGLSLDRFGNKAKSVFSGFARTVSLALTPVKMLSKAVFGLPGLLGAGVGITGLIAMPIQLADNLETARVGFETLFTSSAKGMKGITDVQAYAVQKSDAFMKQIQNFAIKSPFKQSEIITQSQRLMNMGFKDDKIIPMIEKIGNVAAASGKGEEGIARISLALGQMKMKGKLSAEELLQLTEGGVKAWDYLAKGVGKSGEALQKMVSKGLVPVDKGIQYILNGMSEFDGMMDKVSTRTVSGLLSQISDVFEVNIFTSWGKGLQKGAREGLGTVLDYLNKNEDKMVNLNKMLEDLGVRVSMKAYNGIKGMLDALDKVTNSDKFAKADLGGKIKIVWNDVFVKPFDDWWSKDGQKWTGDIANRIGTGLGGFYKGILLSVIGGDAENTGNAYVDAGITAGQKFFDGFMTGFEPSKVASTVGNSFSKLNPFNDKSGQIGGGDMLLYGATAIIFRKQIGSLLKGGLKIGLSKILGKSASGAAGNAAAEGAETIIKGATGAYRGTTMGFGAGKAATEAAEAAAKAGIFSKIFSPMAKIMKNPAMKSVSKVGKVLGPLDIAFSAFDIATSEDKGKAWARNIGGFLGGLGGGALGTLVAPGVGTAVGGIGGNVAGSLAGEWIYDKFFGGQKTVDNFQKTSQQVGQQSMTYAVSGFEAEFTGDPFYDVGIAMATDAQNKMLAGANSVINNIKYSSPWKDFPLQSSQPSQPTNGNTSAGKWNNSIMSLPKKANGGFYNSPSIVGEAGPEVAIPLGGNRRQRGRSLWQQTAQALGVTPMDTSAVGSKSSVTVRVEVSNTPNIQISAQGDANSIAAALEAKQTEIAEKVAYVISQRLQPVLANMP